MNHIQQYGWPVWIQNFVVIQRPSDPNKDHPNTRIRAWKQQVQQLSKNNLVPTKLDVWGTFLQYFVDANWYYPFVQKDWKELLGDKGKDN